LYNNITANLNKAAGDMFKANERIGSAKKINRISDDPVGLVALLDIRASLANITQLERNTNIGKSWLNMAESALSQIEDILTQSKSLCVEMADATKGPSQRASAVGVADGFLRQILSLSNTEVGGRYIFAGTRTDTTPFAFDDVNNPTLVTYSGNDIPFSVKIGKDLNVAVGRDGQDIFGSNWNNDNVFKTLIDLKTSLQNNDVPGIQGAIDKLSTHLGTIRSLIADTGAKAVRLDVKENIIKDLNLTYTERQSQLEDVDVAEAIMDLKSKELAYQAALASSSEVMTLSLLDYV
jgi:flagellar hook-associated protein 3 FlgL